MALAWKRQRRQMDGGGAPVQRGSFSSPKCSFSSFDVCCRHKSNDDGSENARGNQQRASQQRDECNADCTASHAAAACCSPASRCRHVALFQRNLRLSCEAAARTLQLLLRGFGLCNAGARSHTTASQGVCNEGEKKGPMKLRTTRNTCSFYYRRRRIEFAP